MTRRLARNLNLAGGLAIIAAVSATVVLIQIQPPSVEPRFEVASIKPDRGANLTRGVRQLSRGRLITENTPLGFLIEIAYKRRTGWFEISGGPNWINSDGYNITAKAEGDASNEQMYPMLQTLLKERFQLRFHRETRDLPVYNLVAVKSVLKLPNSKAGSCFTDTPGQSAPHPEPGKPPVLPCGNVAMSLSSIGLRLSGGETSVERLALALSGVLGRAVVDKTGFKGTFELDLEFTPDDSLAGLPARGTPGALPTPPPSGDSAGPSIFNALQDRLGLKLESAKGPVTVFVIDHVERPTAN